jgi:hypothetical protein
MFRIFLHQKNDETEHFNLSEPRHRTLPDGFCIERMQFQRPGGSAQNV